MLAAACVALNHVGEGSSPSDPTGGSTAEPIVVNATAEQTRSRWSLCYAREKLNTENLKLNILKKALLV